MLVDICTKLDRNEQNWKIQLESLHGLNNLIERYQTLSKTIKNGKVSAQIEPICSQADIENINPKDSSGDEQTTNWSKLDSLFSVENLQVLVSPMRNLV